MEKVLWTITPDGACSTDAGAVSFVNGASVMQDGPWTVTLRGIRAWSGSDILSGAPDTPLVTIWGDGPRGEPMLLTVRAADFDPIVHALEEHQDLGSGRARELAGRLIMEQMAAPKDRQRKRARR